MTVGFQLTARKVGAIKATGKKQVFTDGNGLRLIVEPSGSKRWLLRRMMSRMTMHAFPKIGGVDMREFSSANVLAALKPIWTALPGIAKRLRVDMGAVVS